LLPIVAVGLGIVVISHLVTTWLRSTMLLALQARVDQHLMRGFFTPPALVALPLLRAAHNRRPDDAPGQ
jgi:ABC-type bacteriocin/lantibiotic exporter with double-glycine peptidase domain